MEYVKLIFEFTYAIAKGFVFEKSLYGIPQIICNGGEFLNIFKFGTQINNP